VLFAPSAGWGAKQWQPQRYAELAKRLAEAGHRVLVNGGTAADEATIAEITTAGDAIRVDSDVAQLIALTRRARLVVGGDTGPVHLAAALERPVVALYGPTDPARNGPFFIGSRVRVVRSPTSRVDYARYQRIEAGLATVTEDEVLASILTLLNGPTGERPRSPSTADGFGTDIFVESTFKTAAFRTDSLFKSLQKEEPETKQADANG
jgi:heptosyltransferase-1